MSVPARFDIEFSDPLLQAERGRLPDHLALIAAYHADGLHGLGERALFLEHAYRKAQVWIAVSLNLTDVLQWVRDDGALPRPGLHVLHQMPSLTFGRVLGCSRLLRGEEELSHAVETVVAGRQLRDRVGKAFLGGLLSTERFDEVARKIAARHALRENGGRGSDPAHDVIELPRWDDYAAVEIAERELRHELVVGRGGQTECCWCGATDGRSDWRAFTLAPCPWKRQQSEGRPLRNREWMLPSELEAMMDCEDELAGEALHAGLRKWIEVAPFSQTSCRGFHDDRTAFLKWAIQGRVRHVVQGLDASEHPLDRRVATVIRFMATWSPLSGAGGLGGVYSHVGWGWIGRELGDPQWTKRKK